MQTPAEVEAMLRDTGGVPFSAGADEAAVATWCHDGTSDQEVLERLDVIAEERVVTLATGRVPRALLAPRAEVTVAGARFGVRKALRRTKDPSLTDVALLEVD